MRSINPATGELLKDYAEHDHGEVRRRLSLAAQTYRKWRQVPMGERAEKFHALSSILKSERCDLATLIALEMGKPIVQAELEVDKCADACSVLAGIGPKYLEPEESSGSQVRFDPLGTILGVMPWNFPLWQVYRFAIPALLAGNVCVLKHASNVSGCALAIEASFRGAGFPEGAFQVLLIPGSGVERVIRSREIQAVSLTGSEAAGRSVAVVCGDTIKKTVLELGGSDPFIVLRDADIPSVAKSATKARIINSGQSCIAAKRFIVEAPVVEEFAEKFVEEMSALKVGDPLDREVEVGPLARPEFVVELHRQVTRSLEQGARLLCGGKRGVERGYFYFPTVLGSCGKGIPAFDEETFGPVAAVCSALSAEEAVSLANESEFGLGASIWTKDAPRAKVLAAEIESGTVFVNDIVRSMPHLPFGGIKRSGYGRELAAYGVREFTNIKTVCWAEGEHG